MLFSENEAKDIWCPFARLPYVADPNDSDGAPSRISINRDRPFGSRDAPCLASGCMAWRWTDLKRPRDGTGPALDPAGYCGLAGKP